MYSSVLDWKYFLDKEEIIIADVYNWRTFSVEVSMFCKLVYGWTDGGCRWLMCKRQKYSNMFVVV